MKTIVNADDFGYSHSVNKAICEAFKRNYISQTTILVNMPALEEALAIAQNEGFMHNVGLHLNLTEGMPLTEKMKQNKRFTNSNGTFNGSLIHMQKYRFFISQKDKLCIKEEVDAQMKKYINLGFELLHIDSHHHLHNNISLIFLIKKLAKKNGFKSMRICRNITSPKEPSFKKYYKRFLNYLIRNSFKTVNCFGEYYYYEKYYQGNEDVEIMVHPDLINGEIVDVLKKDIKWMTMRSYKYHNTQELTTY